MTFALLGISLPVSIYGASKQYFEDNGDGRTILIENSHIHGTIVSSLTVYHYVGVALVCHGTRVCQSGCQKFVRTFLIGREYSTMQYFGVPRHTQSMMT